jgi:hypothetical protein
MAPLDQYLIADRNAKIALARSAAPKAILDSAEVMILDRQTSARDASKCRNFVRELISLTCDHDVEIRNSCGSRPIGDSRYVPSKSISISH